VKLKLDENLGRHCAEVLREVGHSAATVPEEGISGCSDQRLADSAAREARCLVTLDLDFANPLRFPPARYAGIAVLRLPPRAVPEDLLNAVRTLATALTGRTVAGKLWIVEAGRIREYQPEEP